MDASTDLTPGILLFPDGSWRPLKFEELPTYNEMKDSVSVAYHAFITKLLRERRTDIVKPEILGVGHRIFCSLKLHQQTSFHMTIYQDANARSRSTPRTVPSKWVMDKYRHVSGNLLIANSDWRPFSIEFAALVAVPSSALGSKRPTTDAHPAPAKRARLAEDSSSASSDDSSSSDDGAPPVPKRVRAKPTPATKPA